jgi:hypothetical protein
MIRDELLTSQRYWACSPEARNLFVSLLLSADDTGRFTGANFALRVRCMAGTVDSERVEKLLMELTDAEMIVAYHDDKGNRYLFIPRFRQRLRYPHSKYPPPPKEINDIAEKKTDYGQAEDGLESDHGQAQDGRSEVKRREEQRLRRTKIAFDAGRADFTGIDDAQRALWRAAYPRVDLDAELRKAVAWIVANPKRAPKSNWRRFLTSWLARAAEHAPSTVTGFGKVY